MTTEKNIGLVTVLDLNSNTGAEGIGGAAATGTRAGSSIPASNCVVLNHNIARRYRGGHPRTYAPFGANADTATTGTWGGTFLNTCQTNFNAWVAGCLTTSTGGVSLVQYGSVSYFSGGHLRGTPVWDPILSTTSRSRIGSQRRRLLTA
jgi:hypothetical protein